MEQLSSPSGTIFRSVLIFPFVNKNISERDVYSVRVITKTMLSTIVTRLVENSPIRYAIVRNLEWLIPHNIICTRNDQCITQLKNCLIFLVESKHVKDIKCDDIIRQFPMKAGFVPGTARLDTLMHSTVQKREDWGDLWGVTEKLLLLSHGQASVERVFAINKQTMSDNMVKHTIIARVITDHLRSIGGVQNLIMTKELLLSVSSVRQKYYAYLDEERKRKREEKK